LETAAFLKRFTPSVPRRWLWLLAGLMWSAVGILLCTMAGLWLYHVDGPRIVAGASAGFGSGVVIYKFGFSRIARKNINRIAQKPGRVCVFAFQAWQSYVLIALMITLGIILRHSSLPRAVLAHIYSAIGTALVLSSSLYYQKLL